MHINICVELTTFEAVQNAVKELSKIAEYPNVVVDVEIKLS